MLRAAYERAGDHRIRVSGSREAFGTGKLKLERNQFSPDPLASSRQSEAKDVGALDSGLFLA